MSCSPFKKLYYTQTYRSKEVHVFDSPCVTRFDRDLSVLNIPQEGLEIMSLLSLLGSSVREACSHLNVKESVLLDKLRIVFLNHKCTRQRLIHTI